MTSKSVITLMSICLLLSAAPGSSEATRLLRNTNPAGLGDTAPSEYYSSIEQLDHDLEIENAQQQAKYNQIKKVEDEKQRLVQIEIQKKEAILAEKRKQEEAAKAEKARKEAEEAKKMAVNPFKFTIETSTME